MGKLALCKCVGCGDGVQGKNEEGMSTTTLPICCPNPCLTPHPLNAPTAVSSSLSFVLQSAALIWPTSSRHALLLHSSFDCANCQSLMLLTSSPGKGLLNSRFRAYHLNTRRLSPLLPCSRLRSYGPDDLQIMGGIADLLRPPSLLHHLASPR